MNFIVHASGAVLVVLVGALLSTGLVKPIDPSSPIRFGFGIAALAAQFWLFSAALNLRARRSARFDMTVAAETLVALGVFSLITGIVLAVVVSPQVHITLGNSTLQDFEPLLIPFGEGLLASAVAPLLATILRQIEVLKYGTAAGGDALATELESLTKAADDTRLALADVATQARSMSKDLSEMATGSKAVGDVLKVAAGQIGDATRAVTGALQEAATNIGDAGSKVPTALSEAAGKIAASQALVTKTFQQAAEEIIGGSRTVPAAFAIMAKNVAEADKVLSAALARTSSELGGFSGEITKGIAQTKEMSGKFSDLGTEASNTLAVFQRWRELVDSVTDFMRPEKK